jgi:division protein 1
MPILHEHLQPGSKIKEIQAHSDAITALDFDAPFGTLVTAGLDDVVSVWDLNAGRCIGQLEGHLSSVRCLQVDDEIVATGSTDASIRLWDLSNAHYVAHADGFVSKASATDGSADDGDDPDDGLDFQNAEDGAPPPPPGSMRDCPLFALEAHVAEVTALHFRGNTLVSGSADKTLRQWDLEKGRCVQTLDVLWAAAQADAGGGSAAPAAGAAGAAPATATAAGQWRQAAGRPTADATAGFVGALQVFDAALACGTADGLVRLWDLRSGQVHRSLVGHTGPVTALQFDDVHLVTASLDRSIRVGLFTIDGDDF